jgi:hypothetical protein
MVLQVEDQQRKYCRWVKSRFVAIFNREDVSGFIAMLAFFASGLPAHDLPTTGLLCSLSTHATD